MLIDVSRFERGGKREKELIRLFLSLPLLKIALENRQFNFLDSILYIKFCILTQAILCFHMISSDPPHWSL